MRLSQTSGADWITVNHFFDFRAHIEGELVRNTSQGFLRSLLFQLISTTAGIVRTDDIGQNDFEQAPTCYACSLDALLQFPPCFLPAFFPEPKRQSSVLSSGCIVYIYLYNI